MTLTKYAWYATRMDGGESGNGVANTFREACNAMEEWTRHNMNPLGPLAIYQVLPFRIEQPVPVVELPKVRGI